MWGTGKYARLLFLPSNGLMGAKSPILWETYSRLIANPDMEHSYSRGELPKDGCHGIQ